MLFADPSDSKTGSVGPFSCFGSTGKQGPGLPGSPLSAADRPVWFRIWFFRLISSVPHWVRRDQVKKPDQNRFRPFRRWIGVITPILDALSPAPLYK